MTDTTTTQTEDETTEPSVPHLTWITLGCCPRCGLLFTGAKAFNRHWGETCHDPEAVGLVPRDVPWMPGVTAWATGYIPPDV